MKPGLHPHSPEREGDCKLSNILVHISQYVHIDKNRELLCVEKYILSIGDTFRIQMLF